MAHTEDTDVEILQITWLVLRALNCAFYCFMIGVDRSLFFLNFAYCMIFFFFIVRFWRRIAFLGVPSIMFLCSGSRVPRVLRDPQV